MSINEKAKQYADDKAIVAMSTAIEQAFIEGYNQAKKQEKDDNEEPELKETDENGVCIKKDGIVLFATYHLFGLLRYVSFFYWFRFIGKCCFRRRYLCQHPNATLEEVNQVYRETKPFPNDYYTPEIWVLFNLFLAFIGFFVVSIDSRCWVVWCFGLYAPLRIVEIFVYQFNALLFDPIRVGRKTYKLKSATRMILLLLCNILEYILWFSIFYLFIYHLDSRTYSEDYSVVMNSMELLANLSDRTVFQNNPPSTALTVAYVESAIGIFVNILCLARFISLLPAVRTAEKS